MTLSRLSTKMHSSFIIAIWSASAPSKQLDKERDSSLEPACREGAVYDQRETGPYLSSSVAVILREEKIVYTRHSRLMVQMADRKLRKLSAKMTVRCATVFW